DPLQWVQTVPNGILPEPRARFTAVTDRQKKKMWIFGGANDTALMNDVFYIDLTQDPLAWVQVLASGTIPTARQDHMAGMDSKNKMWIVGGAR
ncbi:rngB, partial [Symbiodinium microadriaticum]